MRFDEDPSRNRAIPQCLSAYEQLIASIDISDDILRRKNRVLARYRHAWYDLLAERRHHLKWFKEKESRAKVEFAWEWLISHKGQLTKGYKPFTHYNDIQGFFTSVDMGYDEKELCVRKIKERWKSKQIAARHKTKDLKQCLFILPREIDGLFQKIVDRRGQTRVQVMEDLIKEAAKREFQPESTT